ncbi:MAG TPA: hypothetical protein VFV99_16360 [Kofleriaceae bacterium]|nr:hypothetical protein [Kofleriaceae bacterium]
MSRALVLAILIGSTGCAACGNGSKSPGDQGKVPANASGEEKISVPGAKGAADTGGPGSAATPASAGIGNADDPRFHLKPEEGSITVDKAEGKAGAEATAALKLAPATGYHVATDYPIKLLLEAPAGVKVAKSELSAGGRNKDQGDASTLTEQGLAFAIKATADKPGSYEIKGVFKFGICEKDSCHPKKQPITITVAAN